MKNVLMVVLLLAVVILAAANQQPVTSLSFDNGPQVRGDVKISFRALSTRSAEEGCSAVTFNDVPRIIIECGTGR